MFQKSKLALFVLLSGATFITATASARTISTNSGHPFFFDSNCFQSSDTFVKQTCSPRSYWTMPIPWDSFGTKNIKVIGSANLTCAYYPNSTGVGAPLVIGGVGTNVSVNPGEIGKVTCTMPQNATWVGLDYQP